jgi:uncharacterized membrane protein
MPPFRLSRWLLPVSLSINVFLGVAVAVHLADHESRPPPPPRPERIVEEISATLPAPDADILRHIFAAHSAQMEHGHHAMHTVHDNIRITLSAPTFDPVALHAAFAEGRKGREEMDEALEAILTEAAVQMSPEGRKKLGEWEPPRGRRP